MRRVALVALALALILPGQAAAGGRRLAFVPNDPFAARQWYLTQIHAFDSWPEPPVLAPVKVAIVDSGVDGLHPELAGRIVLARSFVGGSATTDQQGHGTFVAGMIAAATNNQQGIAGIGLGVQLLVAKVVRADRTIPLEAEAEAIRWAVDNGARVINLSLGGLRDPRTPRRDTFSPLEAAAVDYASARGAVLVAAVGNGDQAPSEPWPYASYPAALPHVIGVSALARDGSVPSFSDRDAIYNDLAAPGQDMFSIFPRPLTALRPACPDQGYSSCGPDDYRHAEGTSFAAPQVSAAAALLLSVNPALAPDQVAALLERSADDVNASTGCKGCGASRDPLSGWGRLDVARAVAALQQPLPPRDRFETNDEAGGRARTLWGSARTIRATADFWDDQTDVYRVRLRPGQRLRASVRGPAKGGPQILLWKPGTQTVEPRSLRGLKQRAAQSVGGRAVRRLSYAARTGGWYYLEVKLTRPGFGAYTLSYAKR
jgi:Subtilase family